MLAEWRTLVGSAVRILDITAGRDSVRGGCQHAATITVVCSISRGMKAARRAIATAIATCARSGEGLRG